MLASDKEAGKFTFRFEHAEREWFRHVLELYPARQSAIKADEDVTTNAELEKALASQRARLREDAEIFLKAGKLEIDAAFNEFWDLTLSGDELEHLLQILNNVRVGVWIQLGKPDPSIEELMPTKPNEEQVRKHMVMHVCAAWQATLMSAVDPESSETTPG